MAHSKYTGKTATSHVSWSTDSVPTGCRKITIAEQGKPKTATVDVTVAADTAYVQIDDPMGGAGSASSTVTIEGFLSVTDFVDAGITASGTYDIGDTDELLVHKTGGGDLFTLTGATLKSFTTEASIGVVVPYTVTWEHTTSAGVWSTAA